MEYVGKMLGRYLLVPERAFVIVNAALSIMEACMCAAEVSNNARLT